MATVRHLEHHQLKIEARHTEAEATYSIVKDREGVPYLQIDTYGSADRKLLEKKSQSIRFSPEAIEELRAILERFPRA